MGSSWISKQNDYESVPGFEVLAQGLRMRVYRIQASDGRGPFRPGLSKYWCDYNHMPPATHKAVQEEFGSEWLKECKPGWMYGSACLSLEQLATWFSRKERETLQIMGYHPVALEPDTILRRGMEQLIIGCKKNFAQVAEKLSWNDLMSAQAPNK